MVLINPRSKVRNNIEKGSKDGVRQEHCLKGFLRDKKATPREFPGN